MPRAVLREGCGTSYSVCRWAVLAAWGWEEQSPVILSVGTRLTSGQTCLSPSTDLALKKVQLKKKKWISFVPCTTCSNTCSRRSGRTTWTWDLGFIPGAEPLDSESLQQAVYCTPQIWSHQYAGQRQKFKVQGGDIHTRVTLDLLLALVGPRYKAEVYPHHLCSLETPLWWLVILFYSLSIVNWKKQTNKPKAEPGSWEVCFIQWT